MIKRMVASENEQLLCTVNQLIEGIGRGAAGQGLGELRPSLQRPQLRHQQLRLATQRRVSKVLLWGTPDLRIRMAQTYLTYLGWHPGAIDGIVGKQTRDAMNLFQAKEGLDSTTVLNDETLEHLRSRVLALSD
jgi:peptidoglycan hydrolase-like protein with peptidoglycan-binding domain